MLQKRCKYLTEWNVPVINQIFHITPHRVHIIIDYKSILRKA